MEPKRHKKHENDQWRLPNEGKLNIDKNIVDPSRSRESSLLIEKYWYSFLNMLSSSHLQLHYNYFFSYFFLKLERIFEMYYGINVTDET